MKIANVPVNGADPVYVRLDLYIFHASFPLLVNGFCSIRPFSRFFFGGSRASQWPEHPLGCAANRALPLLGKIAETGAFGDLTRRSPRSGSYKHPQFTV